MTELIWDGKYKDGKKQGPVRIALPFQTIETVNESAQERQRSLEIFAAGRETEWRNRLIWGDKKYVLPSLLPEFAGKVNLIYIDPPFDTGADFSYTATIPDAHATVGAVREPPLQDVEDGAEEVSFHKEPSILEQKAYRDTWGRGLDSYLEWFYEAGVLFQELLHETGTLYVHLDWHVAHYVKLVLDELFGRENFRNEVVWKRTTARSGTEGFNHIHDTILFYSKGEKFPWAVQYTPYSKEYIETMFRDVDSTGKQYRQSPLTAPGLRTGSSGKPWRGCDPSKIGIGRHWALPSYIKTNLSKKAQSNSQVALDELDTMGRIVWSREGEGRPSFKQYVEDLEGVELQSIWTDFGALSSGSPESTNFPTQKPEALLERIIKASSDEGDLVLDCFVGSGTTAAVAEKLNRRWIACDLGRFAIHTTRKRLLGIPNVRPFVVQNLGKYERQAWQAAEFESPVGAVREPPLRTTADHVQDTHLAPPAKNDREMAYRKFILDLYHATPITGRTWLHGTKGSRMVHVGAVDAPVTLADVKAIAKELWKSVGTSGSQIAGRGGSRTAPTESGGNVPVNASVDILGWEFAFEMNETAKQIAAESRVNVAFKKIPREVLDKKAVEQRDVQFFELAALSVDCRRGGSRTALTVTLRLTDFVIPTDDIPLEVRKAIKHWSQMIDYWAVDWDYKGDTFHNQWQAYRTRKDPKIELEAQYTYKEPGKYQIVVKVIDILGNDTTKTIEL